jgi:hypothetical protein
MDEIGPHTIMPLCKPKAYDAIIDKTLAGVSGQHQALFIEEESLIQHKCPQELLES